MVIVSPNETLHIISSNHGTAIRTRLKVLTQFNAEEKFRNMDKRRKHPEKLDINYIFSDNRFLANCVKEGLIEVL